MAHVFEKIDAQLSVMDRRHVTPAGIYLNSKDLQELVEDLDAGLIQADPDGAYRSLPVHEVADGKSYIATNQGGRVFVDMMVHWAT